MYLIYKAEKSGMMAIMIFYKTILIPMVNYMVLAIKSGRTIQKPNTTLEMKFCGTDRRMYTLMTMILNEFQMVIIWALIG